MDTDRTIAYCGGLLIDGYAGEPVPQSTVLVRGSEIVAAGKKNEVPLPPGCTTVDISGKTILPGLIDCHCHFAEVSQDFQVNLFTPRTVQIFQGAEMLKRILRAGFTTVREAGTLNDIGMKIAERKGLLESPRLVMAGGIGQVGGHFDEYYPSGQQLTLYKMELCPGGVEAARASVRKVLREGYDFVKVCATGGVVSSADEPDFTEWSPEELDVFVYEARARNRAVMAHCIGTRGTKNAIRAGIWSVEHGVMLDDEAVGMMVEHGTFLVPTLFILHEISAHGKEMGLTPVSLAKANHLLERHIASFQLALAAGVKIAVGTDGIVEEQHGRNAVELELLVKYGMSPLQAIGAATRTAAQVCRVDTLTGALETGKQADLLVVDGNPLEDIRILQDPARLLTVMKAGEAYVDKIGRLE